MHRGGAARRPPPDPQPRHHRRLALPSRSGGRTGVSVRARTTPPWWSRGRTAAREIAIAEFPVAFMTPAIELNEIVTAIDAARLAAGPRLRLRRIRAPARRLRHRVGGCAARRSTAARSRACVGDARRRRGGAASRAPNSSRRSSARRRPANCSARPAKAAARIEAIDGRPRARRSIASISPPCCRAARWRRPRALPTTRRGDEVH